MATKIKICGLQHVEDADFVNEAKPDFAGVMMCRRFCRSVDMDQAKAIRKRLDPSIPLVGVFVNDQFMDVLVALRQGIVNCVQLQGTESEEYISHLQMLSGKPIIKCCQMNETTDPAQVIPYMVDSCAEHIMFGTGGETRFDWSVLQGITRPFILSGGLTPDNVQEAIEQVHPWGVDFLGGVETDGIKDRDKILAAVEAVRQL